MFHVTEAGEVRRGDKVLDDVDLDNLLVDAFARDRGTEVVIKRARKAPASALERVVQRASAIGFARVSIALY